jgi:hypothetical protein
MTKENQLQLMPSPLMPLTNRLYVTIVENQAILPHIVQSLTKRQIINTLLMLKATLFTALVDQITILIPTRP